MLDNLILSSEGRIITVTFVKKDGTMRTLNGRIGVIKHLKGGVSTLNPEKFITIYDMQSKGYRAINRDTIKGVTIGGVTHINFEGKS